MVFNAANIGRNPVSSYSEALKYSFLSEKQPHLRVKQSF